MENNLRIISVRENPEYRDITIEYLQSKWQLIPPIVYENCISHCLLSKSPLPQWYLLKKDHLIIGCAGLITNDFISRMDLYPWICGVFIEESHRGNAYASILMEKAKSDARRAGFRSVYLCTGHIGFYEKYGFSYVGEGYHPWEESSRIYECILGSELENEVLDDTEGRINFC